MEREESLALVSVVRRAEAQAPENVLPPGQTETVLNLDVEGIEIVDERRVVAVRLVVVSAQLKVGTLTEFVRPPRQCVAPGHSGDEPAGGSRPAGNADGGYYLANVAFVGVCLEGDGVLAAQVPIRAQAEVGELPIVIPRPVRVELAGAIESFGEDSKIEPV